MAQRLSDAHVRNARSKEKAYKIADGRGLYLLISPNGSKLWRYKYRIAHKENVFAIGRYPQVTLQQAREYRESANRLVAQCIHPSAERKDRKLKNILEVENSFSMVAGDWLSTQSNKWNEHYLRKARKIFVDDVFPRLGHMPIASIKSAHIYDVLKSAEGRGAPTIALLIKQWCSAIFLHARARGITSSDPISSLAGVIERPRVKHKRALSPKEIGEFLVDLEGSTGDEAIRLGIQILLLTFVRPAELRGALWSEIDFAEGDWRISRDRMKMGDPHLVPLSHQAAELFSRLWLNHRGLPNVFPNARNPKLEMSPSTFNRFLERMGYKGKLSAHGFRATASTILNGKGYGADVIERQLAHQSRDRVRASYNHADYASERRSMMQNWADYIDVLKEQATSRRAVQQRHREGTA